ncbi:hypothetical protein HOK31_08275 [Candidatus Poribacteria bacterium]|nr:hypothetical protein [Candidatus Poribacteria bacterium]
MQHLLQTIRDDLLATPDTVCLERARLVTEAYQEHDGIPILGKRAHAFRHVLRNMTLDLTTNPIFAGNTSTQPRAWMLVPEHGFQGDGQIVIENEALKGFPGHAIPEDLREYWEGRSFGGSAGIGHLAVDFRRVVHEGLESVIEEAGDDRPLPDHDALTYRVTAGRCCRAVIEWAGRYAETAARAAEETDDAQLRALHLRVASACSHVPAKPARNLFEALQSIVLVHLATAIEGHGMSISIGLPDRVLEPFLEDTDDTTDLLCAFILKIAANSTYGSASKTQAITVGGADHTGADRSNALTLRFLDAFDRTRVGDPHVFVRWHDRLDARVKERAVEMLRDGAGMPLLINDAATARGFEDSGVAPEDAWEYCVIGCNELGIPGRMARSATSGGGIVYLEHLNRMLLEDPDAVSMRDMDDLMARYAARVTDHVIRSTDAYHRRMQRAAELVPTPFTSALMWDCLRAGRDLAVHNYYNLPGIYERSLTNAANALAAIEETVFTQRSLTMADLIEQMRRDFSDDAMHRLLRDAPKWGTDDARADRWAEELVRLREVALRHVEARLGLSRHVVCHVVRSLHHVDGRRIAASPDGRHAWEPVADSVGAETGTASEGLPSMLLSVLKLGAREHYRGGYNLNLTMLRPNTTPETMMGLIDGFFGEGGQELQIACWDAGLLRDAMRQPDRHGDLVVRVAGFNARFVDLSRREQEELADRLDCVVAH